jgi:hypothetical protein
MSSFPAMAVEMSWVTSKACQRLLLLNAVTAKVRLTNKSHKNDLPDFLYIYVQLAWRIFSRSVQENFSRHQQSFFTLPMLEKFSGTFCSGALSHLTRTASGKSLRGSHSKKGRLLKNQ